jgi:hypothetical protein
MGAVFYKARIEGVPTSEHPAGVYEFTLTTVAGVEGAWPDWLSPRHRDP